MNIMLYRLLLNYNSPLRSLKGACSAYEKINIRVDNHKKITPTTARKSRHLIDVRMVLLDWLLRLGIPPQWRTRRYGIDQQLPLNH